MSKNEVISNLSILLHRKVVNIYSIYSFILPQPLVVHCRQGWGRTGIVLAMHLMIAYKKSAKEAIGEVRRVRYDCLSTAASCFCFGKLTKRFA